ncbi:DMT family transporter [Notoacmeibacter sp. MSK16QG-6]|uniref:DMT family transporter n=1 Tax=Notoacmeibacter sp. MSK16QG-6 TaxID=2957982 RepID=UPI0020A0348E|nr:DMT family transporter [Notoacmeibacter sp. MSK16QG-6]MCP1199463.1 DMT family transporter [Notoacmeibacter sp. MSK16QG-6]
MIYELAALSAALCWAFAGIISHGPSTKLGAVAFVRLRLVIVSVLFGIWVFYVGTWSTLTASATAALILSGMIGIFLGDWALFVTMNRLGPRLTSILFSLNAPMAVILGWVVLDERLKSTTIFGIGLTLIGVILAIAFGRRASQRHIFETTHGSLRAGVALGLIAAFCQAVASLIARPVMETGVDPIAASLVRLATGAVALSLLMLFVRSTRQQAPLDPRTFVIVVVSAILAMALGMTLVLFALIGGEVGIVSTLTATTPVLILPLLWITTRERPAAGAFAGAALVVVGTALLFNR